MAGARTTQAVGGASAAHSLSYRPDIDGLRAVAVLLVVAFHAFPNVVKGGYVGVDIFFVISGYLISSIILDSLQSGTFSFLDFYRRRIRRIFPSLIVILVATMLVGWLVLSPIGLAALGKNIEASAAFVPNLVLWREAGYFDTAAETKPLLHLWSLGVEEQFYLCWPLTLFIVTKLKLPLKAVILFILAVSFLACVTIVRSDSAAAFYSPFTRFWELLIGAMLAANREWLDNSRLSDFAHLSDVCSIIGVALIAASVLLLTQDSTFPGWWAVLPTMGAALIIASRPSARVNRVLATRGLVAIGLISYPLYLWHWPLLSFAFIRDKGTPPIETRLAAVIAAFILAGLTYLIVEKYFRRGRNAHWHMYLLVGLMVVAGSAGAVLKFEDGFKSHLPVTIETVLSYASYEYATDARANGPTVCWLSSERPFSDFSPGCNVKPGGGGMLVWGDSHAGRLYAGLRRSLGADANIGQFTRDSCPPILDWSTGNCRSSNASILAQIKSAPPKTVVLYAAWSAYDSDWSASSPTVTLIMSTMEDLRSAGVANVVLVGPGPRWKADLPTLIYDDWNQQAAPKVIPERLTSGADLALYATDAGLKAMAQSDHFVYVSLLDLLCNEKGCLTYVPGSNGELFTWDVGHLTTDGAAYIADKMVAVGTIP